MNNKLYDMLDKLRGNVKQTDYVILVASITLLHYHDENKIQILLQSSEFNKKNYEKEVEVAAKELGIKIPNLLEKLKTILENLEIKTLQEFLFDALNIFKTLTPKMLFENFIKNSETISGKRRGENSSPEGINKLALKLLNTSKKESFLDPSCGYGNAIVTLLESDPEQEIFGQEINPLVSEITIVRILLCEGVNTTIQVGDVLKKPQYTDNTDLKKFDTVYSDAPMGLKMKSFEVFKEDSYNRFIYGTPPKSSADWGFISNGISSLDDKGRGVFLTSTGSLFRAGAEKKIRQRILDFDLVEAIISLAPGLLSSTAIPTVLLIINKNKAENRKNKVLMINAEEIVSKEKQDFLSKENIQFIYDLYTNNQSVDQFSKYIDIKNIEDSNLLPSKYVINTEMEDKDLGKLRLNLEKINELETVELGEISEIKRGFNLTSKDESEDGIYRVIKISDVQEGKIDYRHLARCNIKENIKIENYLIEKGDILISTRGTTIKIAVVFEEVKNIILSQNFNVIRLNNKVNPVWLKMFLESPIGQYQLELNAAGTVVKLLQTDAIKAIKIPIESLEKQTEIVSIYEKESEKIFEEIKRLQIQLKLEKMRAFNSMGLGETFELITNNKED